MPIGVRELLCGFGEHRVSRHDVHDGEADDPLRVVEGQAVTGPRATVMADKMKALKPEGSHETGLVFGKRAK